MHLFPVQVDTGQVGTSGQIRAQGSGPKGSRPRGEISEKLNEKNRKFLLSGTDDIANVSTIYKNK